MGQKIVIIGGVASGPKTAARARRLAPDADITIIERGHLISYAGCGMPFFLSGKIRDYIQLFSTSYGVVRDEEYFMEERGIKVLTGTEAVSIDRTGKTVKLRNVATGEYSSINYDKLVLATGSEPITPPIEGLNLKGVFRLNYPEDALKIREFLDEKNITAAVVIGAGMIGMEAVDALLEKQIFPTVIDIKDQVLPGILDRDLAQLLASRLEERGVEFLLGETVLKIKGDEEGNVTGVITDGGEVDADLVIVAVGVRPNVQLARECGLAIGETGAIAVNEYLQTSDPDIYALGDCVENTHLVSGRKVYTPMASVANRQGRVVGDNVTGRRTKFKGVLGTAVMQVGGINVARTGLGRDQAESLGYRTVTSLNATHDTTHYHPNSKKILIKIIADANSGRILGAQGLGPGEVVKRIDVIATAITFGATVDDIHGIDLGYSPPFATPIDAVAHAANIVRNKLDGIAEGITAAELKEKLESKEDFVLLDVRTLQQYKPKHIEDERGMVIPLGELRRRLDEVPRDKQVITVCVLGIRSYEAARILRGAGYKDVKFLEGGLEAWPYDLD